MKIRHYTLSVVCPSLVCRQGMSDILADLGRQAKGKRCEVLSLADNGVMTIGEKMNVLNATARGQYISAVADDDRVAPDYVATLLEAIAHGNPDVVTFNVDWQAGEPFMDWPVSSCDLRPIAAVRASIAKRFTFPDWWQSEDRAFRAWLHTQAPAVAHIDKTLYGYKFKRSKPEFGGAMYPQGGHMASAGEVAAVLRDQAG